MKNYLANSKTNFRNSKIQKLISNNVLGDPTSPIQTQRLPSGKINKKKQTNSYESLKNNFNSKKNDKENTSLTESSDILDQFWEIILLHFFDLLQIFGGEFLSFVLFKFEYLASKRKSSYLSWAHERFLYISNFPQRKSKWISWK